jgi:hypothetical protein
MDSDPNNRLSRALEQWRLRPARDPNFRAAVWQRIDAVANLSWSAWLRNHRLSWSVAAAFALIVAGWGGRTLAETRLNAQRESMVVAYLSELDPRVLTKLQR